MREPVAVQPASRARRQSCASAGPACQAKVVAPAQLRIAVHLIMSMPEYQPI
jgi:hypothetical protein